MGRNVQYKELLIMQFSQAPVLLGPNSLLSTLLSNTLHLYSSRDQVSYPHRTIDKIKDLYAFGSSD
jgi:hypothetical protein